MVDEEIERDVVATIARIAKVPADKLKPEIDLRRDLRFDSLMGLKILAALEKRFDVTIPDEEIDKTRTVAAAVAAVKRLVKERK
jgi:acyl carrier protein